VPAAAPGPIDPPLHGPAIEALTTSIEQAFTVEELEELVLFTFSEGLFTVYVPEGVTGHSTTMRLLLALERRGTVAIFLRAARTARPHKEALISIIKQYCPSAMLEAPPAGVRVDAVLEGLNRLSTLRTDPVVDSLINESQEKLRSLAGGLKRMRAYKILHDALHNIQVARYRQLVTDIRASRTDPTVTGGLNSQILGIRSFLKSAHLGAEMLADDAERGSALRWIGVLDKGTVDLESAVEELDDLTARRAVKLIGGVLREKPPDVNDKLRSAAENLPLGSLIDTVDHVAEHPGLDPAQKSVLVPAMVALNAIWLQLRGKVTEHDQWQSVETQLWGADAIINDGPLKEVTDFEDYWIAAKSYLKVLWAADPVAAWVAKSGQSGADIDTAINKKPPDTAAIEQTYGRFRFQTQRQFLEVDSALGQLCEQILRLSEPVTRMLEG
jgi:hypothetical protein